MYGYLLTTNTTEHVAKNTTTMYKKTQMANTHADSRHSSNQGLNINICRRPQTLKKQDPNGLYIENDIIQMNIMTLTVEDGGSLLLE